MTLRNATRSLAPAFRGLAYRQTRTISPRQFSASAHSAPKSSDTTWMIVSSLIFIPTIGYLLSPSARSKPHHAHSATSHGQSHAPAENTPTAPPAEPIKNEETTADAERTEVPAEQVTEPIAQVVRQDSPSEAAQAEVDMAESKNEDDAQGEASTEANRKEIEKPQAEAEPEGTAQDNKPRPTDLGKAREQTNQANAPKQAASSNA